MFDQSVRNNTFLEVLYPCSTADMKTWRILTVDKMKINCKLILGNFPSDYIMRADENASHFMSVYVPVIVHLANCGHIQNMQGFIVIHNES